MKNSVFILLIALLAVTACGERQSPAPNAVSDATFFMPQGDPIAGRKAFATMRCFGCHPVEGDGFPAPVARPEVPIRLGPDQARQPRTKLAESIIAPSHQVPAGIANVTHDDGSSRMGEFNYVMTVEQLIDIVAYLKSLDPDQSMSSRTAAAAH